MKNLHHDLDDADIASDPVWTLDEGLAFIKMLRENTRQAGYDVALTGSILYQGTSAKDIDIILYPISSDKQDKFALAVELGRSSLRLKRTNEVKGGWKYAGKTDAKHVEEWEWNGKCVDLFYLT